MKLVFACGHGMTIGDNPQTAPLCVICGEPRIQAVQSRPPRFTGVASGPYVEYANLGPATVNLAPKGPLALKATEE